MTNEPDNHCPGCPAPASPEPDRSGAVSIPLTSMKRGQMGFVRRSSLAADDSALLSAMGLCCNARVRLCRVGQPCIVAVTSGRGAECRIGLARPLAERILVDVVDDTARVP